MYGITITRVLSFGGQKQDSRATTWTDWPRRRSGRKKLLELKLGIKEP